MPATDDQLKEGVRVILGAFEDAPVEVGVIDWIADEERPGNPGEGREALVVIPRELRRPDDWDGMREVFFDAATLSRTEVF